MVLIFAIAGTGGRAVTTTTTGTLTRTATGGFNTGGFKAGANDFIKKFTFLWAEASLLLEWALSDRELVGEGWVPTGPETQTSVGFQWRPVGQPFCCIDPNPLRTRTPAGCPCPPGAGVAPVGSR